MLKIISIARGRCIVALALVAVLATVASACPTCKEGLDAERSAASVAGGGLLLQHPVHDVDALHSLGHAGLRGLQLGQEGQAAPAGGRPACGRGRRLAERLLGHCPKIRPPTLPRVSRNSSGFFVVCDWKTRYGTRYTPVRLALEQ